MRSAYSPAAYLLSFAICLLSWKIVSFALSSSVLPPPEDALKAFFISCKTVFFWENFGISAYRVIVSIIIAWCIAFPLGIFIGYGKHLDRIFSPIIFMTYPIPKIILLPVILLIFGLGNLSKIILISLILFFQILVAVRDGVKAIDEKYIDSIRSMGAHKSDILRDVIVPAALPYSFTALRISTGIAISALFFVESFATSSGLGYMIMDSWAKAEYNQIFVGIIGMSALGLILYECFGILERRVCAWRYSGEGVPVERTREIKTFFYKVKVYLRMIKFSHTIFALPFAFAAAVLAGRFSPLTTHTIFWIIMAMIGARSAAMGFNRLADAVIDKKNPRTIEREIPAGSLTSMEAMGFVIASATLFIFSSAMLSLLCFWLSFPVLCVLFFYSYTKRFTWLSHIVLGLSISLAPVGVWVAMMGTLSLKILLLSFALLTYIAGFDILYACQDVEFDRQEGLFSIPSVFGTERAFTIASLLHVLSFLSLMSLYWIFALSPVYLVFVFIIGILFVIEHRLVKPDDLRKIDIAFFDVNSIISILVFISVLFGELLRKV